MIYSARYVLPISTNFIEDGAVVVDSDVIVDIGTLEDMKAKYPEHEVTDFGLAALLPGFIDCHTHLDHAVMRGMVEDREYSDWKLELMKIEARMTDEDWRESARFGVLEATLSGITTVADISTKVGAAQAVHDVGMRAIIYREVETMDKSSVNAVMLEADADIKAWQEEIASDRITIGIAPHSAYLCHPELFRQVADYAIKNDLPVAMHLAGSFEEYDFVKYGSSSLGFDVRAQYDRSAPPWLPTGVSPVRYVLQWGIFDVENILAIHCTQVDDDDVSILASRDVAIAYCPRCNAKLGMGIAPLYKFVKAGIRVGLGTDSPAASDSLDVFEEMRIGLLLQRAAYGRERFLSAHDALYSATLGAAKALKIDDQVGSLEIGKQADMIAVDLSQSSQAPTHKPKSALVHTAHQNNVIMTMVAGVEIYKQGEWLWIDTTNMRKRLEDIRSHLRTF